MIKIIIHRICAYWYIPVRDLYTTSTSPKLHRADIGRIGERPPITVAAFELFLCMRSGDDHR